MHLYDLEVIVRHTNNFSENSGVDIDFQGFWTENILSPEFFQSPHEFQPLLNPSFGAPSPNYINSTD